MPILPGTHHISFKRAPGQKHCSRVGWDEIRHECNKEKEEKCKRSGAMMQNVTGQLCYGMKFSMSSLGALRSGSGTRRVQIFQGVAHHLPHSS
jgi:hypothetical protein